MNTGDKIYTLMDRDNRKFISKIDNETIYLGDKPKLMSLKEALSYKNRYQLGIVVNLYNRPVADIQYDTGLRKKDTPVYSNVPKEILINNNLIYKILYELDTHHSWNWDWKYQTIQISMSFDISNNPAHFSNKFEISFGPFVEEYDTDKELESFTYMTNVSLIELQEAFKSSCIEYGLIFDTSNKLKIKTDNEHMFTGDDKSEISIEMLKYLEDIGIDIELHFNYDKNRYEEFKQTGKRLPFSLYRTDEDFFAKIKIGPFGLANLIFDITKLKLPHAIIEYDPDQEIVESKFNGYNLNNDMDMVLGYGLFNFNEWP